MGHTNYMSNKPAFTDAQWAAFCNDVKAILKLHARFLADGHGTKGTKPHVGRAEIAFNGRGDDAHETCYIPKAASEFEFCKTAQKPYDGAVVAVYRLVRKYLPSTELSSDGGDEVFNGKRIVVNNKWTYFSGEFDVNVGDVVELPHGHRNGKSYSDGTWEGQVTAIGSDYDGDCKTILGVVAPPPVIFTKPILPRSPTINDEVYDLLRPHLPATKAAELADEILDVVIARLKE